MSKFNVGDLVEIHRNPNDETWVYFNPEMHKYLGKRATIMRVGISNSFGLPIFAKELLIALFIEINSPSSSFLPAFVFPPLSISLPS